MPLPALLDACLAACDKDIRCLSASAQVLLSRIFLCSTLTPDLCLISRRAARRIHSLYHAQYSTLTLYDHTTNKATTPTAYPYHASQAGSSRRASVVPQSTSGTDNTTKSACTVLCRCLVARSNTSYGDVHEWRPSNGAAIATALLNIRILPSEHRCRCRTTHHAVTPWSHACKGGPPYSFPHLQRDGYRNRGR
jgi:hypothetical protein